MENYDDLDQVVFDDEALSLLKKEQEEALARDIRRQFLAQWSPAEIQRALDSRVLGQPAVTAAVADFLHYHVLRQVCPQLKPRPILISGPSGCGKTEVFRAAGELFRDYLSIRIIDGSMLSGDGWAGNYKLTDSITGEFADGGVLVIDEFDKLAAPCYTSHGTNASASIQSQLLKLLEGELIKTDKGGENPVPTDRMGIALVGAFEGIGIQRELAEEEETRRASCRAVGFLAEPQRAKTFRETPEDYQEAEFIRYGVLPEIMSRISVCCTARLLNVGVYREMIFLPTSRVSMLLKVLQSQGIPAKSAISDRELMALIVRSMKDHTGARWVSAQVEKRILDSLRDVHLNFFEPEFPPIRERA